MGTIYVDGLKNTDMTGGAEGTMPHFSPSYSTLQDYGSRDSFRGSHTKSSHAMIERAVEASVLTRLLRRHGTLHPPAGNTARPIPQDSDYDQFLTRLAEGDGPGALAWLTPWRHPLGILDDRMAGLLAMAAHGLGKAWESDRLSFAEVSLGLVTLQRVLHDFAPTSVAAPFTERHMFLAPVPGEVHCFGVRLLAIRFQQAGWDCRCEAGLSEEGLIRRVAEQSFDVLGLSIYDARGEAEAPGLIRRLREASRKPGLFILLGGAPLAERPGAALACGADLPALPFAELLEALERSFPALGVEV